MPRVPVGRSDCQLEGIWEKMKKISIMLGHFRPPSSISIPSLFSPLRRGRTPLDSPVSGPGTMTVRPTRQNWTPAPAGRPRGPARARSQSSGEATVMNPQQVIQELVQKVDRLRARLNVLEEREAFHVRQEETLRLQARVLESMTEGVSLCDERGGILYTNPAFDAMFGYGTGELVGKPLAALTADTPAEHAAHLD